MNDFPEASFADVFWDQFAEAGDVWIEPLGIF